MLKISSALIFLGVSTSIFAIPVQYANQDVKDFNSNIALKFMKSYGYLEERKPSSNMQEAENLYKEDSVVRGIKNVQKYAAIPETGLLDNETIALFSSPRCGVKDMNDPNSERMKRFVIGGKNWRKRTLTYFIGNWSPKVNHSTMTKYMQLSFAAWSSYSNLKFVQVNDSSADILISFGAGYHGDAYPFDGPGNILAHAFYPYEEDSYGGDIHFDNDENWLDGARNLNEGVDFLSVAVHELGHSLGLAHSPVYNSIMFPYYKGPNLAQLDYDDILAMYQLYITKSLEESSLEHVTPKIVKVTDDSDEDSDETTTKIPKTSEQEEEEEDDNLTPIPDLCTGDIDAAVVLKSRTIIVKGNYLWEFTSNFSLLFGSPMKIRKKFPKLPKRFTKIDAMFLRVKDEVVIFSGIEYLIYDIRGPIFNGPYSIDNFISDPEVKNIDAAMVWARNNKTYLFSGSTFWRFDDQLRKLDSGNPREWHRWNGIPENLDATLTLEDTKTYFFKGKYFWLYDNARVRPEKGYKRKIASLFDSMCAFSQF